MLFSWRRRKKIEIIKKLDSLCCRWWVTFEQFFHKSSLDCGQVNVFRLLWPVVVDGGRHTLENYKQREETKEIGLTKRVFHWTWNISHFSSLAIFLFYLFPSFPLFWLRIVNSRNEKRKWNDGWNVVYL